MVGEHARCQSLAWPSAPVPQSPSAALLKRDLDNVLVCVWRFLQGVVGEVRLNANQRTELGLAFTTIRDVLQSDVLEKVVLPGLGEVGRSEEGSRGDGKGLRGRVGQSCEGWSESHRAGTLEGTRNGSVADRVNGSGVDRVNGSVADRVNGSVADRVNGSVVDRVNGSVVDPKIDHGHPILVTFDSKLRKKGLLKGPIREGESGKDTREPVGSAVFRTFNSNPFKPMFIRTSQLNRNSLKNIIKVKTLNC